LPNLTVSPLVRQKLSALGRRVSWAQRLNSAAVLVQTLVALHLVLFALWLGIGLNTVGMRLALALFVTVGIALVAWLLRRQTRARPTDRTLASLFERRYHALGEKLLSTVELSGVSDDDAGFITLLANDTDRQMASLDPRAAYSLRRAARGAIVAGCVLLAALVLLAASPRYARFSARLFGAWSGPGAGYRLEVSPGDTWTARGRSATVAARLFLDEADERLPADCFVVFREEGGKPQRVRMDRADADVFLFSWPNLRHDVTYHVEAGELVSEPFRLAVVDAIELAKAPDIQVTPPPYVNPEFMPVRTWTDGGPFSAAQFSRIRLTLEFTARPVRVQLILRDALSAGVLAEPGIVLNESGRTASVDLSAERCGTFAWTLLIEGEHGITTTVALPGWSVRPDGMPHFTTPLHVRGVRNRVLYEKENVVSSDDPLRVQAVVEDAEGLGIVALEYRVNEGPAVSVPWIDAAGQLRVDIDRSLLMPRGLKEGDRFRFRLRAADNRELAKDALGHGVPPRALVPQVAFSPGPDRWVELKVGKSADSLLVQEIADQHGDMQRLIEQVRQKLRKEHALMAPLRQASHQQAEISPAQVQQLAEVGRLNQQAADDLEQLAAKLAAVPELAPLGDHLHAIGEAELTDVAQALARFKARGRSAGEREKDVQAGETAVLQAIKKLDGLASLGERLAQGRLDRLEMERLAMEEQELARRAEDLLARSDAADPKAVSELAELRAEQDRVAARLAQLAEKSDLLQEALAQVQQAEAKRLADEAGELAKVIQDLKQAAAEQKGQPQPNPLKALTQAKEKKLQKEMKQLADDTLRLSQQATGPEAKKMAQESAHAAEQARQAMDKGMAEKAKGKPSEAGAAESETLKQLEIARKSLAGLGNKMPTPPAGSKTPTKTAQALAEGQMQVQLAQKKLQGQPSQASKAMQQAANALDTTAQHMGQQMAQSLPKLAGRPAIAAGGGGAPGGMALPAPLARKLEPFQGRSWGELPGELKTQLLQDARTYFGDDYAPIIQQYFEQIAERRKE
jgi:hypothetical protein